MKDLVKRSSFRGRNLLNSVSRALSPSRGKSPNGKKDSAKEKKISNFADQRRNKSKRNQEKASVESGSRKTNSGRLPSTSSSEGSAATVVANTTDQQLSSGTSSENSGGSTPTQSPVVIEYIGEDSKAMDGVGGRGGGGGGGYSQDVIYESRKLLFRKMIELEMKEAGKTAETVDKDSVADSWDEMEESFAKIYEPIVSADGEKLFSTIDKERYLMQSNYYLKSQISKMSDEELLYNLSFVGNNSPPNHFIPIGDMKDSGFYATAAEQHQVFAEVHRSQSALSNKSDSTLGKESKDSEHETDFESCSELSRNIRNLETSLMRRQKQSSREPDNDSWKSMPTDDDAIYVSRSEILSRHELTPMHSTDVIGYHHCPSSLPKRSSRKILSRSEILSRLENVQERAEAKTPSEISFGTSHDSWSVKEHEALYERHVNAGSADEAEDNHYDGSESDYDNESGVVSRPRRLKGEVRMEAGRAELQRRVMAILATQQHIAPATKSRVMDIINEHIQEDYAGLDYDQFQERNDQIRERLKEALAHDWETLSNINLGLIYVPMEENCSVNSKKSGLSRDLSDYDTLGSLDSLIFEPKVPSDCAIAEESEENSSMSASSFLSISLNVLPSVSDANKTEFPAVEKNLSSSISDVYQGKCITYNPENNETSVFSFPLSGVESAKSPAKASADANQLLSNVIARPTPNNSPYVGLDAHKGIDSAARGAPYENVVYNLNGKEYDAGARCPSDPHNAAAEQEEMQQTVQEGVEVSNGQQCQPKQHRNSGSSYSSAASAPPQHSCSVPPITSALALDGIINSAERTELSSGESSAASTQSVKSLESNHSELSAPSSPRKSPNDLVSVCLDDVVPPAIPERNSFYHSNVLQCTALNIKENNSQVPCVSEEKIYTSTESEVQSTDIVSKPPPPPLPSDKQPTSNFKKKLFSGFANLAFRKFTTSSSKENLKNSAEAAGVVSKQRVESNDMTGSSSQENFLGGGLHNSSAAKEKRLLNTPDFIQSSTVNDTGTCSIILTQSKHLECQKEISIADGAADEDQCENSCACISTSLDSESESITSMESVIYKAQSGLMFNPQVTKNLNRKDKYVVNQGNESDTSEFDKSASVSTNMNIDSDTSWDYVQATSSEKPREHNDHSEVFRNASSMSEESSEFYGPRVIGNLRRRKDGGAATASTNLSVPSPIENFFNELKKKEPRLVSQSSSMDGSKEEDHFPPVMLLKHHIYQSIDSLNSQKREEDDNKTLNGGCAELQVYGSRHGEPLYGARNALVYQSMNGAYVSRQQPSQVEEEQPPVIIRNGKVVEITEEMFRGSTLDKDKRACCRDTKDSTSSSSSENTGTGGQNELASSRPSSENEESNPKDVEEASSEVAKIVSDSSSVEETKNAETKQNDNVKEKSDTEAILKTEENDQPTENREEASEKEKQNSINRFNSKEKIKRVQKMGVSVMGGQNNDLMMKELKLKLRHKFSGDIGEVEEKRAMSPVFDKVSVKSSKNSVASKREQLAPHMSRIFGSFHVKRQMLNQENSQNEKQAVEKPPLAEPTDSVLVEEKEVEVKSRKNEESKESIEICGPSGQIEHMWLPTPDYTPFSTIARSKASGESSPSQDDGECRLLDVTSLSRFDCCERSCVPTPDYDDSASALPCPECDCESYACSSESAQSVVKKSASCTSSPKRSVRFNMQKQFSDASATWSDVESVIFAEDRSFGSVLVEGSSRLPMPGPFSSGAPTPDIKGRMESYQDEMLWDQLAQMRRSKLREDRERWETEKTKRMLLWIHMASSSDNKAQWCYRSHWWKVKPPQTFKKNSSVYHIKKQTAPQLK